MHSLCSPEYHRGLLHPNATGLLAWIRTLLRTRLRKGSSTALSANETVLSSTLQIPSMASRPPACPRRPPPPYRETASHMRNRANPLPLARTTSGGMTKQNSRDEEQSHSLIQEQEHRLLSLQLLETRSINRALEERHREDGNEIEGLIHERAELFHANGSLWEALETARATIEHLQIEAQRMSKELSRQAVLVDDERKLRLSATGEIHPNKAEMATTAVATLHRNAPQLDPSTSGVRRTSPRSDNNVEHNSACPLVPKLEEHIQLSLRIMIGRWMEDVQATLGPENKEALEMPWVLHRLFSLCSDLIHDQHEELVKTLSGEGCPVERPDGSVTPADTAAFMRHLRRHHLTLFPLSGASLLITIDSIMMALSHRCVYFSPQSLSCIGCCERRTSTFSELKLPAAALISND